MAAGSRAKMRQRMRVSCHNGCWRSAVRFSCVMLIAQLPASQVDEHVFERGMVCGKPRQRVPGLLEMVEQERQRFVQLLDRVRASVTAAFHSMPARQGA